MIYTLPFILAGISRLHGSELFPFKILKSLLWALPFAVVVFSLAQTDIIMEGTLALWTLGLCAAGKSTGHGNGIDLGTKPRGKDERLEFIIKAYFGEIQEYWYDVILLSITGFAAVSGAVFSFLFINPWFSGIILLCGALKGPAYMIGYRFGGKTVTGEILTGFFAGCGLMACFLLTTN